MEFNKLIAKAKDKHGRVCIVLAISMLIVVVFSKTHILHNPIIYNPYIVMTLEYISFFLTLGLVVYGYTKYTKTAKECKLIENEKQKQINFVRAKRLQNRILYVVNFVNILLILLTFKQQFIYLASISMVFNLINFPTIANYQRDFVEKEEEDHYEQEFTKEDENNIKQLF